jgi:uncharacterized protein
MPVLTTSLYAALLAIICIVLAGRVGAMRGNKNISLGDHGDADLIVANRRHMNFVENVPLALLLMALVELNGGSKTLLHVFGASLLVARLIHPFGLDMDSVTRWQRLAGAGVTALVIVAASITLLWQYFR